MQLESKKGDTLHLKAGQPVFQEGWQAGSKQKLFFVSGPHSRLMQPCLSVGTVHDECVVIWTWTDYGFVPTHRLKIGLPFSQHLDEGSPNCVGIHR